MRLNSRHLYKSLALLIFLAMAAASVALWRGIIPVEWLASFGYKGIFLLSLINSMSPIAGPSQIATFFVASKLNPLLVGISGGIGGAIGELTGYLLGYFFRASLPKDAERTFARFRNWHFVRVSRDRSFVPLFVLACIPNPVFDPVSALAGSLGIGFGKYFTPVLLGRTLRHVLIAYAGFYSISLNSRFLATETTMTLILGSLPFIGTVILIALAAWIIRSFAESDPDPLILNFTFFAVAGQAILTPELMKAIDAGWVAGLSFVALVLVLLQVLTIRDHATVTVERYRTVLNTNRTDACTDADIEHWAIALVRITGRDFSPQFSNNNSEASDSGSRGRRRREALNVLPKSLFKVGTNGIEQTTLTIPDKLRRWRWWAYVGICIASWLLFLGCILIVRLHK